MFNNQLSKREKFWFTELADFWRTNTPNYGWFPQVALVAKNLPGNAGDLKEPCFWSLGREGPLGKGTATHFSILAWRILWTEEPGGLESTGSQSQTQLKRLSRHDWFQVTNQVVTEWEVGAYHQGWGLEINALCRTLKDMLGDKK